MISNAITKPSRKFSFLIWIERLYGFIKDKVFFKLKNIFKVCAPPAIY